MSAQIHLPKDAHPADNSRAVAEVRERDASRDALPRFLGERKYTIRKAAELMMISASRLRRLIGEGQVPHLRLGGRLYVMEADMEAYLADNYLTSRPPTLTRTPRLSMLPPEVTASKHLRR